MTLESLLIWVMLNILLSGGTLIAIIAFLLKAGRVLERQDVHTNELDKLRESHHDIRDVIQAHVADHRIHGRPE